MAVDPVPYVVHGAKHSADVFRQAFYDATSGVKGVSTYSSMEVSATPTPSGQVSVSPGGLIMPNSYSGGGGQSYTGRNASETLVDVPPSDSTGSKTWYIIFRVQDPQFGGPVPTDPLVGPYAFVECVSSTVTVADPHYRLARIVVPASTATVESSMITDLRNVANPVIGAPRTLARPRITDDNSAQNWLNASIDTGGEYFPGGAGSFNVSRTVVPDDALSMIVEAEFQGVRYTANQNVYGQYWIEFGDEFKDHTWPYDRQYEFATQAFQFDSPAAANTMRTNWPLANVVPVPSKLRGALTTFVFKAGYYANSDTDGVSMDAMSGQHLKVTFLREPAHYNGFN